MPWGGGSVVKESKSLGVNFKWDLLENALDFIA
jgi:hypothetical protein